MADNENIQEVGTSPGKVSLRIGNETFTVSFYQVEQPDSVAVRGRICVVIDVIDSDRLYLLCCKLHLYPHRMKTFNEDMISFNTPNDYAIG